MLGYMCDLANDGLLEVVLPDGDGETVGFSQSALESGVTGKAVVLSGHSIWETPEGKWVEVTHGARVATRHLFTPVAFGDDPNFYTHRFNLVVPRRYKKDGIALEQYGKWVNIPYSGAVKVHRQGKFREMFTFQLSGSADANQADKDYISQGGFNEPSISTGKSFNQIRAEKLAA